MSNFDFYTADGEGVLNYELEDNFKSEMNELLNPFVPFADYEYLGGDVLAEVDPIMFRQMFLEWIDEKEQAGELVRYFNREA